MITVHVTPTGQGMKVTAFIAVYNFVKQTGNILVKNALYITHIQVKVILHPVEKLKLSLILF